MDGGGGAVGRQSFTALVGASGSGSADPTDEGPLLRGGMLAQAADWLARRRGDLSQKERAYIEASVALSERLEAEKKEALAREQARLSGCTPARVTRAPWR